MGGGDLNLKKSWHPSTLRNIERVWKAEQKNEAEKQKIEQLQKELADERAREEIQTYAENQGVVKKKDQKLDWMYQGPAAMMNRDEFLLGRKIDKTFETLKEIETGKGASKNEEPEFGESVFSSQSTSDVTTVDLANKIREDPLFSIMKKEKEERKNLLTNPVKMKQLQQLLEKSIGSKKSKKSKSKKKKRNSSDSEEDIPSRKHRKYIESFKNDLKKEKEARLYSKHKTSDEEYYINKKSRKEYDEFNYKKDKKSYYSSQRHVDNQSSPPSTERYSKHKEPRYERKDYRESFDASTRSHYQKKDCSPKPEKKRKLDASERDRLLREMQENAKWRDNQRKRNFERYKEEEEREEKADKMDASDFVKPILSKAAVKGSLENRVKQKIFSIQRSNRDMEKNFARRH